jgi:aspartyl-tRNA(Asn)/glutamyl-tRNA(Gln) amidotransferase subunit B
MRSKEEANDYRYFPDPDLLPVVIHPEFVERLRTELPELPDAKRDRFIGAYGLSDYDAGVLTGSRELADFFEAVAADCGAPKLSANWVMGEFSAALNRSEIDLRDSPVSAAGLAQLLCRIEDKTLSGKLAKDVFEAMWAGEGDADAVIAARGLKQITDTGAIDAIIDAVISANPAQVEQYRSGKDKVFGFFVGQVMKQTQGKANPAQVNERLRARLLGD